MKGSRHLVLVGDHKQLPPVVQSQAAKEGGLGKSLFERLMDAGAPSALLQVQYRMHPSLSAFPNAQFYDGLLVDGVRAADRTRPQGFAFPSASHNVVLVDVDGEEQTSQRGSHSNEKEAEVVVRLVTRLVERCGLRTGQIGIISPYKAQVQLLARKLPFETTTKVGGGGDDDDEAARLNLLECKSVDGYQGREKEVIVFSAVRCNSRREIGFLKDWRRLNVALTRARRALVVVGSCRTLRGDENWGAFVEWAEANGCVAKASQL
ncbi:putative Regulator of nonsense transcripts 1 [Monoraphidium neglectum]|uniref:Putative Regulator of nonsense transcripts 1 n=1 Tax=Monoraphidium neglectum TaxID=145388 RepID=A0A0D2NFD9_9CHLO|nr:putative Regulator of nonsense transcripts 1 [Monoraphidium neglectum]KIZ03846.1 putative Regulator of nonsense transcripts 1 [Monoraphidium neglectum]|eukprot:XP_013902865.1 putative Regulator of nonsense transcripts 1 [Monoraphidium neglectum]